jgi:hypothetical protein
MLIGSIVAGFAVVIAQPWLFFVGVGIIVLGAVAGKVMQMMGLGQPPGFEQDEASRRVGEDRHAAG